MILTQPSAHVAVLAGGAFDPLHAGHVAYLGAASVFGPLTVTVATDAYIQQAKGRPVLLSQAHRMAVIGALRGVAAVHAQDERGEAGALHDLQPQWYVKGSDWRDRLPFAEREACLRFRIEPTFVNTAGDSSSKRLNTYVHALHERGLRQLEILIASQKPASEPWQPTSAVPYDFDSRKAAEGIHPQLIKDVLQPTSVWDAGCGPGHLVRLLREIGVDALGFDTTAPSYHAPWQEQVRYCSRHNLLDVEEDRDYRLSPRDLVICREVLEHMTIRQIRVAVPNLCELSTRFVYVTTRFNPQPAHLFDVQTADNLDPDHRSMLPQTFLRALFVLEGFQRRDDLEKRLDHMGKKRVLVYERPQ